MVARKGYKLTEVGEIPEDWEVVPLGELAEKVGSGITPTGGQKVYSLTGRPFMRSQNVGWGKLLLDDIVFISDEVHARFPETELKLYDVLLNITGASIGRCAIVDNSIIKGNVNQHVCIIRARKEKIDSYFLCNFILFSSGQRQIDSFQAGGNRQGLNFVQIRSMHVAIPSTLKEQTSIATALSDADALIDALEQCIAKKRHIKQGAMQELLTGKRRLPGFWGESQGYKLTEVGEIPDDWEVVALGELGEALIGLTYSLDDVREFGTLVLRSSNIQGNSLSFEDNVYVEKIIPDRIMTKKGDLLICVRNGSRSLIGKSVLLDDRADGSTFGAFMTVFRSQIGCLLSQLFQSELIKKQISEHIGATINQITNASLTAFCIPIPPTLDEQTAIAAVLTAMDDEIAALEAKLSKARQIKAGMMQELLTGRIRLV